MNVRRFLARSLDRLAWWVAESPRDRRIRRESKAAALAEEATPNDCDRAFWDCNITPPESGSTLQRYDGTDA